jgi:hypothetical protein
MTKPSSSKKRQQSFDDEDGSEPSRSLSQSSSGIAKRPRNSTKSQSDQKLDLILQKLASIENQNSEIVTKVKHIELRVESTENSIKLVRADCDLLTDSVLKLQADLTSNTHCAIPQVSAIESSISSLLSESSTHRNEHELLYAEVNKLNLLIAGIAESPQENDSFAAHEVQRLITDITGRKITVDVAHRVGKYMPNKVRMIKVRFLSMLERNCVYFHRKNLNHPCYINEDLSPQTRNDHSILRRKKNDILRVCKDAAIKIDWKRKSLQYETTSYEVINGILIQKTPQQQTLDGSFLDNPEFSRTSLPPTRVSRHP